MKRLVQMNQLSQRYKFDYVMFDGRYPHFQNKLNY